MLVVGKRIVGLRLDAEHTPDNLRPVRGRLAISCIALLAAACGGATPHGRSSGTPVPAAEIDETRLACEPERCEAEIYAAWTSGRRSEALDRATWACEHEVPYGCAFLGLAYEEGSGVAQDPVRAASYYNEACEGGEPAGCNNLALLYQRGEGVPEDLARAVTLFEQACDANHGDGCFNLGNRYRLGDGAPADDARAAELYEKACSRGSPEGCNNLAFLMTEGRGVEIDVARARELYGMACDEGLTSACEAREALPPPEEEPR
jgi:TPR repeat protein